MNLAALAAATAERAPLPDTITRLGIAALVERTSRGLLQAEEALTGNFAQAMRSLPIATSVADANAQHYEVPAAFFDLVLGPQRKYSCCLFSGANHRWRMPKRLRCRRPRSMPTSAMGSTSSNWAAAGVRYHCGWYALSRPPAYLRCPTRIRNANTFNTR